jgi:hypothetical protein
MSWECAGRKNGLGEATNADISKSISPPSGNLQLYNNAVSCLDQASLRQCFNDMTDWG